ncbi:hypothetical protein OIV83_004958 [Microbotryomycetes sp. JL201]|nr:hypothetical protein OIV83_004958 [Microbotryomycetes sp. JL201]
MATWADRARLAASSSTLATNATGMVAGGSSHEQAVIGHHRADSSASRSASPASTSTNWRAAAAPSPSSLPTSVPAELRQQSADATTSDEGEWHQPTRKHDAKGKRQQQAPAQTPSGRHSVSAQQSHKADKAATGAGKQRHRPALDLPAASTTTSARDPITRPTNTKSPVQSNDAVDNAEAGLGVDPYAQNKDLAPSDDSTLPRTDLDEPAGHAAEGDVHVSTDAAAAQAQKRPAKRPAPAPKVNVWAVRTQQLKSAASPVSTSEQPTPDRSQPASPSSSSSRALPAVEAALPVESWPAPNEDVASAGPTVQEKPVSRPVSDSSDVGKRPKGDKTKWIPLQAEIVFASAPASKRAGSGGKSTTSNSAPPPAGAGNKSNKSASRVSQPTSTSPLASAPFKPSKAGSSHSQQPPRAHEAKAGTSDRSALQPAAVQLEKLRETVTAEPARTTAATSSSATILDSQAKNEHVRQPSPVDSRPTSGKEATAPAGAQMSKGSAATNGVQHSQGQGAFRGGRGGAQRGAFRGSRGSAHRNAGFNGHQFGRPQYSAHSSETVDQQSPRASKHVEVSPVMADQNKAAHMSIPVFDPRTLDPTRYWLLGQLEWWFSVDNLCRDMYLRSKMDAEGWIEIAIIAAFNRIRNLTTDVAVVHETMMLTPLLEVVDGFVRLRQHWPEWVLPSAAPSRVSEERLAAARLRDPHHLYLQQQQQFYMAAMQEQVQMAQQQAIPRPELASKSATSRVLSHSRRGALDSERGGSSDDEEGAGTAATTVSTGSQIGEEDAAQTVKEALLSESADAALSA